MPAPEEAARPLPKSYLSDVDRAVAYADGLSDDSICMDESTAAEKAGDDAASWAWMARAELPAHTLAFLKGQNGAQFIRDLGFRTRKADEAYGPGWLDRPDSEP
ncbi:MAG: hypothetical protein FWF20_07605 [Betaproteobacteria bacterium]|nr:hypothetical protein [Betaproteobacteria bacterium]MCL2886633.1 hypothetical protein [Betaproteobacteria bacterium]